MTMILGKNYDAWLDDFASKTIEINGIKTAVYSAPVVDIRLPVVLFVHGINGDYHGLVPVAYELRDACRAVFVDLPGHGQTEIPQAGDIYEQVSHWARELPTALQKIGLRPLAAVGHSFGGYVAQQTGLDVLGILNPSFEASALSRLGTAILDKVAPIIRRAYSSYPVMIRRGHWLIHARTKATDEIVAWASRHAHVTPAQFRFQTRFATILAVKELVDVPWLATRKKLLMILSQYDRIVDNSKARLEMLTKATIVTLPTDHVSVFEMPKQVAAEIRKLL